MNDEIPNAQLKLAFDFVQQTNTNLFLTGKAGTGKTTFLRNLKIISPKRMIVLAPTGVAAINAGGVTIHSFFQMHFGPHIPGQGQQFDQKAGGDPKKTFDRSQRFSREKINIIKSLDLLVIDEISMVRADLLDSIDEVLRRFRDYKKPFGGVQLLMIGDLQQLAPVVKDEEWELLRPYYSSLFFFGSHALQKTDFTTIELKHIYRQSDEKFISLLNKVRENQTDQQTIDALNERYIEGFEPENDEGYITLTTHNYQSQAINETKLRQIKSQAYHFTADVQGEFPEYSYPADFELIVKEGAQVMFVKNDISKEKLFYNGKIGKVISIEDDVIFVECEGDDSIIPVTPAEWTNNKYSIDEQTKEITETPVGSFKQYPLKLAWAITIHKSQGLTFERAIIDANAAFAHGQVYVALSRCKTMEGMVLSSRISTASIKSDVSVKGFSEQAEQNQPGEKELLASRIAYQQTLLVELLDFSMIQRRLHTIQKLIKENEPILPPGMPAIFLKMSDNLSEDLMGVVSKFNPQIGQMLSNEPMVEANEALQERIKKASSYFAEKIEAHISSVLQNTDIETDNKEVRKALHEAFENLYQEAFAKTACFKACQAGFTVKAYLAAKALASIEKIQIKKPSAAKTASAQTFDPSTPLIKTLKNWRTEKADEENVPAYVILHQSTLYELVTKLPLTLSKLKEVKGFGKKRIAKYGEEILAIIRNSGQSIHNDTFEPDEPHESEVIRKKKPEKGSSRRASFELFRQGKTIEEIARERVYAVTTIEGHLAAFVETGELNVLELISPEKLELITEYFKSSANLSLSDAITALENKATYGELRMVKSHLIFQNKLDQLTV